MTKDSRKDPPVSPSIPIQNDATNDDLNDNNIKKKEQNDPGSKSSEREEDAVTPSILEELPSFDQFRISSTETSSTEELQGETNIVAAKESSSILSPPHHHQSRSIFSPMTAIVSNSSDNADKKYESTSNQQESNDDKFGNNQFESKNTSSDPAAATSAEAVATTSSSALPPKPSSSSSESTNFAQLAFRTLETYVTDAIHEAKAEQFPPLQMFQQMNICDVTGGGLARLTNSVSSMGQSIQEHHHTHGQRDTRRRPSKPIALRHIRSTPLQHTPSNLLDDEDEEEPPPIGLDILNRSRSTPLSMSKNSAFVRSNSQLSQDLTLSRQGSNSSAFTALAPYPMKKASSRSTETDVRPAIFNPIRLTDDIDDEVGEMTSIEIVNVPKKDKSDSASKKNKKKTKKTPPQPEPKPPNPGSQTVTAASKAAKKFFSDVRKLRVRQKVRGGRENPAQPPSVSDDSSAGNNRHGASSIRDDETLSSKSSSGQSGSTGQNNRAIKSNVGSGGVATTKKHPSDGSSSASTKAAGTKKIDVGSSPSSSCQHDDENRTNYRSLDDRGSPASVPSAVYQQLDDDSPAQNHVAIEVSGNVDRLTLASSPEPGRSSRAGGASTPHSQDSPETSRYSSTTSSSGHVTHATSVTYSTGQGTTLSAISETDREVMELNKGGAKSGGRTTREKDGETVDSDKTENIELSLAASGRSVRFGDYVELVDTPSPVNPRDGATVQADRFFKFNDRAEKRGLARLRSLPSVKRGGSSHSPTTISSASANTNSSASTMAGDEPPMIVSYIDRKLDKKQVSDLTSHHRETQSSSPRSGVEDRELRESSPSDQILAEDAEVLFEGSQTTASKDTSATRTSRPRPIWPAKGLQLGRKIRSLPPRSPHKGVRGSATPPPRGGSPAAAIPSPPRQIVDSTVESSLLTSADKAYVLAPASSRLQPGGYAQSTTGGGDTNYTQIPGDSIATVVGDHGSHEVIRLSPTPATSSNPTDGTASGGVARSYYNMTTGLPRGPSPVGHGRSTYEESGIEILKTNSKEEVATSSTSPVPFVTPDHTTSSSC